MSLTNIIEYTVSELSQDLKAKIERDYSHIRVRGEISGAKQAASGHWYLTLKDNDNTLDGVIWRYQANQLTHMPEDGLEVIAYGKLTTYGGRSKYQLIIDNIEPYGIGALLKQLEQRRQKLLAEGLFDNQHKKSLPYLPTVIGIITSPTGAVIKDIMHRINERFKRHIVFIPVKVQGDGAAADIIAAINAMQQLPKNDIPRPDVVIIARGGGSLEDLWCFNDENLIRAVFHCSIPIISAVGHETDHSLLDFVADYRAPTPTQAGEKIVPVHEDLYFTIMQYGQRLSHIMTDYFHYTHKNFSLLVRSLTNPQDYFNQAQQRCDDYDEDLQKAWRLQQQYYKQQLQQIHIPKPSAYIDKYQYHCQQLGIRLHQQIMSYMQQQQNYLDKMTTAIKLLSHQSILERGFAIVKNQSGDIITNKHDALKEQYYQLLFKDGKVSVKQEKEPKQHELFS